MDDTTRPNMQVLFIFLCLLGGYTIVRASKDCYVALNECYEDTKCSRKLSHYANECGTIVDISSSTRFPCSKNCVNSIKSLMQTTSGKVLWKCECNLDAHCLTLKSRTGKCLAIANGTYRKRLGCTAVLHACIIDPKCKNAQVEFLVKCYKMFVLTECTRECLRSQRKLFGLPMGKPLTDCECDGVNEMYCLGLRAYADEMKCNSWRNRRIRRTRRKRRRQRKGDALPGKRKRREG